MDKLSRLRALSKRRGFLRNVRGRAGETQQEKHFAQTKICKEQKDTTGPCQQLDNIQAIN